MRTPLKSRTRKARLALIGLAVAALAAIPTVAAASTSHSHATSSDSAYLASYLATVPGPVVLVGHSYGGFVTTNAATGDKDVKALVYVDAYIPAKGDTINSLTAQFPGSQIIPAALNFVPSPGGVTDVYIKPSLFRGILANDLPASQAAELAATQRPIAATAC